MDFPDPDGPVMRVCLEASSWLRSSGASGCVSRVVGWWVGRRPKGRRALRDRAVGLALVQIGVGAWIGRVEDLFLLFGMGPTPEWLCVRLCAWLDLWCAPGAVGGLGF